jgi:hypothetical protein
MSMINHPSFLRTVLRIDAATCVATGLLMSVGSGVVASLTQISSGLLISAGLSLFPIAAFIAFVALRSPLWYVGVWLVIVGNIGWVLASLWLLAGGAINANAFGSAFILIQAVAVAVLAYFEYAGLDRPRSAS